MLKLNVFCKNLKTSILNRKPETKSSYPNVMEYERNVHKIKMNGSNLVLGHLGQKPHPSIHAYLPTHDTGSQEEYSECLDIMHTLFMKFQGTYDVILCGDLNGTLLDRTNKHDKLPMELVCELNLSTGIPCRSKPTFYRHAGTSTSQIDYILVKDKTHISEYVILDRSPICSSAHVPVKATLTSTIRSTCHSIKNVRKRP